MKKARPRTARRAAERETRKDVSARLRLAALEPGGAPARPIEVVSASLVEPSARAAPCPVCGAGVRALEHRVEVHGDRSLRVVDVECATCGYRGARFFAIVRPLPS